MDLNYLAKLEADPTRSGSAGFLATFPDVPEAIASGPTREAALAEAREALLAGLITYVERGLPLPPARAKRGEPVALDATASLKLAVLDAFRSAGISRVELARRLGKAETEARRILDPDHATKLPALEAALAALGKRVVLSVEDA